MATPKRSNLMKCKLCDEPIEKYDPLFNHVKIDERHSADICLDCVGKIIQWQGKVFSVLFPTKAMKKRFERK